MADTHQPKAGSLWARIMGLNDADDAPPAPVATPVATVATPVAEEAPVEAEAVDVVDAEVVDAAEVVEADVAEAVVADDDAVPLDDTHEPSDPNPTIKFNNVAPPVPVFAQNPLEDIVPPMAMPVIKEIPRAAPVVFASPVAKPMEARPIEAKPIEAKPVEAAPAVPATLPPCSSCGAPRKAGLIFCDDCGYLFPTGSAAVASAAFAPVAHAAAEIPMAASAAPEPANSLRIKDRYLVGQLISEKLGVKRHRGLDAGVEPSAPVIIVSAPVEDEAAPLEAIALPADDDFLPTFDADLSDLGTTTETLPMADLQALLGWPRPNWELSLLEKINIPALPTVIDSFTENGIEYLVLEIPEGQILWDAWDDPDSDASTRYGYLKQIAETLDAIHQAGAMIECLSPDHIIVDAQKKVRIADIGDLIPLPIPKNAPLRGNLYTPPELIASPESADARASLYTIGAILYSLEYLHHGLEEKDFESKYVPKQITDRFPDVHPLFPRLINKTFVKDVYSRFPTDEAGRTDPTGFKELIQTLTVCQRVFDTVRLDIAAWTTTGMVRTGNEDAFAFLHGVDSRQDELFEYALILLCDGMGGYDAGEVAAALAITEMKKFFLQQPMFAGLAGKEAFPGPVDVEAAKKLFEAGLKHGNKEVFTASRVPGKGKRGMGCTAEAVYVDPHHVIVGHVGDSRVYHLKDGRLLQLTRDQTLVNRLVELGQIKAEDAENHPRKNELQQAIGGQPDVHPGVYHSRLKRGDWVLVCSDGLSNHISNPELEKMLTREASNSSEEAARRLLNLVNLRGATDNATIVVIRAT